MDPGSVRGQAERHEQAEQLFLTVAVWPQQGRALGVVALAAAVGLFWLGKRMAIENRVMKRRRG